MTYSSEQIDGSNVVEEQAVRWLIARDEPQTWTDAIQKEFDAWLTASPAHQTAFWQVEASWSRIDLIADVRQLGLGVNRPKGQGRPWVSLFRVAAGLGLFAVLGMSGALYFKQPDMETFATPIGGHKVITLIDGSKVELNTNTVIQIGIGANQRSVRLVRGEAFFQVYHDAAHSFTVAAAGHRLTDLGTKFLMRAHDQNLEVALLEGRASLESEGAQSSAPLILQPGDVAKSTGRSVVLEKKSTRMLLDRLAWRKGILVFDNTPLNEAVAEFNRYNVEKIVIDDLSGAHFKLNGAVRTNDREEFTHLARSLFGLRVEERGSEIVIRR